MFKMDGPTLVRRALSTVALAAVGVVGLWWLQLGWTASESVSSAGVAPPALGGGMLPLRRQAPHSTQQWSVQHGQLVPGRALRDRFDSYLPVGPGVSMVEVRQALARDALGDLGPDLSAKVLLVWDRYARLQSYNWTHPYRPQDVSSWRATLDEQQRVRRVFLGAWAPVFFSDEEAVMRLRLLRGQSTKKAEAIAATDWAALAPTSAASDAVRLVDWPHRLELARLEWARLGLDDTLDEAQRLLQMRHYLQQGFSTVERERAARELDLP